MEADRFQFAPCSQDNAPSTKFNPRHYVVPPRLKRPCYAPTFQGSSTLYCIIFAILGVVLLAGLLLLLILTLGSDGIMCMIRQLLFRMQYCRVGNSDSGIDLADPYQQHVHRYRGLYGKDAAWEQWMLDNRNRYEAVFRNAMARPQSIVIAFRYDSLPIAYNPAWASEAEHMLALDTLNELTYPGYDFAFSFNGDPATSFATAIAGIPTNSSQAVGSTVYLYYEGIFTHEFAHVLGVLHHYDSVATIGNGEHMPPGETKCLMDRNSSQFCSACRTALDLALNVDNGPAISGALQNINMRYPY